MKRSEINVIIKRNIEFLKSQNFPLPRLPSRFFSSVSETVRKAMKENVKRP